MISRQEQPATPPTHDAAGICFGLGHGLGDLGHGAARAIEGYLEKGVAADLVVALGDVERAQGILRRARGWMETRMAGPLAPPPRGDRRGRRARRACV